MEIEQGGLATNKRRTNELCKRQVNGFEVEGSLGAQGKAGGRVRRMESKKRAVPKNTAL